MPTCIAIVIDGVSRLRLAAGIVLACTLLATAPDVGSEVPDADVGPYVMEAAPLGDAPPIRLDGILNDLAWSKAKPIKGFVQKEPNPGQPASEDTEVRILYSPTKLYVGARCYARPGKTVTFLSRRDDSYESDAIAIFLDSRHDHRTGWKFACGALGCMEDAYRYDDNKKDNSWDGIWNCRTSLDSLGWTAEFEIPLSNLRFPDRAEHTWGINFERWFANGESTSWKPIGPNDGGLWRMSSLGHLIGIGQIQQARHVEVYPYTTAWTSQRGTEGAARRSDVGFDLNYGLSTNMRLSTTFNPDFAQVEADRTEINLSRYPTRFPEKRPFFMEGNNVFSTPIELFYSRRIGSTGDILWGGKFTGKIGDYTVGLLGAQTGGWDYFGLRRDDEAQEEAVYSVYRVSRDLFTRSNLGILAASKDHDGSYSRVAGLDGRFSFLGPCVASGQIAASSRSGNSADGQAYRFSFDRWTDRFETSLNGQIIDPEFYTNATGYQGKEEHRGWKSAGFSFGYGPRVQALGLKRIYSSYQAGLSQSSFTDAYFEALSRQAGIAVGPDFDRDQISWRQSLSVDWQFGTESLLDEISAWFDHSKEVEITDTYRSHSFGAWLGTQRNRIVSGGIYSYTGTYYNWGRKYVGTSTTVGLSGLARPNDHADLDAELDYAKSSDPDGKTDGRYWNLSARSTVFLNRDIFLRLFGQAELNRTYYGGASTTRGYFVSGLLGWEFMPRSNVFLAYNERRSDDGGASRLDNRAILMKVSYLFTL